MFCTQPIVIYKRGEAPPVNPATGIPVWPKVACGQCPTCQAGRKNDWAGRLIAEAKSAASVYFLTLTYKDEPDEFRYADVQQQLYLMRTHLARYHAGTKLRFFVVGERGNKFGRIHWHMLVFLDQKHDGAMFRKWNKWTNPKQLWDYWPHGWTDIAVVPSDDIVRRVRYCAKYAVKTVGSDQSCRLRCSLKPAIGGAYLRQIAEFAAECALPLNGFFTIPGMVWERGNRKGQSVRYRLMGASARNMCRHYIEAWVARYPKTPFRITRFLDRYTRYSFCPVAEAQGKVKVEHEGSALMWLRHYYPNAPLPVMDWRSDGTHWLPQRAAEVAAQAEKQWNERFGTIHVNEIPPDARCAEPLTRQDEWHHAFDYDRENRVARGRRADYVAESGISADDPEAQRFIETGQFDQESGPIGGQLAEIYWSRGDGSAGQTHFPDTFQTEAQRRHADGIRAAERARFKAQRAAWKAGCQGAEQVDPETGEVSVVAVRIYDRKAVPPEKSPARAPAPPAPRPGGLGERAYAHALYEFGTIKKGRG